MVKPCGDVFPVAEKCRFAGENYKHGLSDLFGLSCVAELAAGRSVNQGGVPFDDRSESIVRASCGVFAEQLLIAAFVHFTDKAAAESRKPKRFFLHKSRWRKSVGLARRGWAEWGG